MAHPVDQILVDGVAVAKADVRGFAKLRQRLRVADADEIRNTDFSGQFGGLYVASLDDDFNLDTADTTTADDGVTCIEDAAGNRFKLRVLATPLTAPAYREHTAAGEATVATSDDILAINKDSGAATNVNLGGAAARAGRPIIIKDLKGDAGANPITPVTSGGELIDGIAASNYAIVTDRGAITLYPKTEGTDGWFTLL